MSFLDGPVDAYRHNGDDKLLRSLGLRTHNFGRDWTDLGTVILEEETQETYGNPKVTKTKPATTISVNVAALPAQFWSFIITRPRDEIKEDGDKWEAVYEPVEIFEVRTGSGGFSDYWPGVKAIAEHCFEVEKISG